MEGIIESLAQGERQLLKISPMVTLENVPLERNAVTLAWKRYQGAMPTRSGIALFLMSCIDVL